MTGSEQDTFSCLIIIRIAFDGPHSMGEQQASIFWFLQA
jgi:hypothetical protein